ncbi:hypothetical protein GUP44_003876 [Salmonella enterica]|nr:hypothetical protein [Salmonella enterica]
MAVFSLAMSTALLKMAYSKEYGFIYFGVMVVSFVFTVVTLIYKVSEYDINSSANVQVTALYQVSQTNINDCSQLASNEYGHFLKMKENVINYCGTQQINDFSYFTSNAINAMYSVLYNEFSLASIFIATPERKDHCLVAVDLFLAMCPDKKIYFSQKNLQMLRDFERKQ